MPGRFIDKFISLYTRESEPGGWYTGVWRSEPAEHSDNMVMTIHAWVDATGAHVEMVVDDAPDV